VCSTHTKIAAQKTVTVLAPYHGPEWLVLCIHPCLPIEHIAKTCTLCLLCLHALDRLCIWRNDFTAAMLMKNKTEYVVWMSHRSSSPVGQYQSPSQLKQARHSDSALPVAGAADQGAEVNPGEIASIDLNCQLCDNLGHQLLCRLWSCTRR